MRRSFFAAVIIVLLLGPLPAWSDGAGSDWFVLGSWRSVANADDVRALALTDGGLWMASEAGGVVKWSADGSWQQYLAPQDGLPSSSVRDIVAWRGAWWFGTDDGLAVYDPGRDRMVPLSVDLPSPSVTSLAVDAQDRLWVGTTARWDMSVTYPGQAEPGGWIGGGMAFTDDGVRFHVLGAANGLPSTNVRDITVWRGEVWVATAPYWNWSPPENDGDQTRPGRWDLVGGGVARYDGDKWEAFDSKLVDVMSNNVRAVSGGPRALWIGTAGRGLVAYDGAQWHAHMDCGDDARCIQDNYVTAVAAGADGAVWVGTSRFNGRGTGLGVLDPGQTPVDETDDAWHVVDAADGLPGALVRAILPAPDGTVWIGTSDLDSSSLSHGTGLAHLLADRATIEVHRTGTSMSAGPADNYVSAVAWHPTMRELWIGTRRAGIDVMEPDGGWRHYSAASTGGGLASDHVSDIAIEPNGVVWVATRESTFDASRSEWTDGGLSRFDGASWRVFSGPQSGLPSDNLSALALDGRGRLWVGTGATDEGAKEHAFRGWGLAVFDTASGTWQRTYSFPTLTSNNITDIAVTDREVWVATSYFFYVDTRTGGAQVPTGGGVSVFDMDSGTWRTYTDQQGLTISARSGSGTNLLDFRAIEVSDEGVAWLGGLAYHDELVDPDRAPDGILESISPAGAVRHTVFGTVGGVTDLSSDPQGHIWAVTAGDGARARMNGQWVSVDAAHCGLPCSRLTKLSFGGSEFWLATSGSGLLQLVPPSTAGAEPADPVIIRRLPFKAFLPQLKTERR